MFLNGSVQVPSKRTSSKNISVHVALSNMNSQASQLMPGSKPPYIGDLHPTLNDRNPHNGVYTFPTIGLIFPSPTILLMGP